MRRWWFVIVALLLGSGALRLEIDNGSQRFISAPSESYRRMVREFGPDDSSRIALIGSAARGPAAHLWLEARAAELARLPGVTAVLGPVENAPPTLAPLLATADASSILVAYEPLPAAPRRERMRQVEATLAAAPVPADTTMVRAGLPGLDGALDAASREVVVRELPALVVITVALLWWCLGRHLLSVLALVGGVFAVTFGALGWLGVELDLVLAVLPPLLFAMSVATSLHLLLRWREHQTRADTGAPIETTWKELRWAVIWSGLTSVVGFLSLSLAPVAPVARLGWAAAAGLVVLTTASLWWLPQLLSRHADRSIGHAERRFDRWAQARGRRVALWATSHPGWVLAGAALIVGLSLVGVRFLRVESNALCYLEQDHPVRTAVETLEAHQLGMVGLHLLVEQDQGLDLQRLQRVEERLRQVPGVLAVAGPGNLPHPFLDPVGHQVGALVWWRPASQVARVVVSIPAGTVAELDQLREQIDGVTASEGLDATITGTYVELLETQRRLLQTLGLSLIASAATIALVLRFLLGSARLALVALAPNLWPVAVVLGLMGCTGVPLDVATVLVGAVVLGIAVDDSLHLLGGVRHRRHLEPRQAVVDTVEATTPAFLLTGMALMLGFAVCSLSAFLPTARFGLLASVAIALAVVADVVLLPALLAVTQKS